MTWTRRRFLETAGLTGLVALGTSPGVRAAASKTATLAHSVSTFVYGQHLVAKEKRFFEEEGLSVPSFLVPGGGAKVAQTVTAGQALFGLGDSNHPLKATERGKETVILFPTDTRCSYANILVRRELWERGVRSVEALADQKLVGRKAIIAATAIGSGTYVYGAYVLRHTRAADGRPVNDQVEWVGGGASMTMLGGLKAGKFDAIMAVPEWQWEAEAEGFARPVYDVLDEKGWNRVFGGKIPVTVGYTLRETIERSPDVVQAYVNAMYRAQQWIRGAKDEEIVELLHRPYMDTFKREIVLRSVQYYKTIFDWDFLVDEKDYENGLRVFIPIALEKPVPFAKAVEPSFVRKARSKYKS